jgi:hypothetical protein
METKLKSVITEAAQSDSLYKIDWATLPLPQVMVQNDKTRILANPEASTWGSPYMAATASSAQTYKHDESSKKRKSAEYQTDSSSNGFPPWRQTNKQKAFEDRITYSPTDKRQRIDFKNPTSKSKANLEMRKKRFEDTRGSYGSSPSSRAASPSPTLTGPGWKVPGAGEELLSVDVRAKPGYRPPTACPYEDPGPVEEEMEKRQQLHLHL